MPNCNVKYAHNLFIDTGLYPETIYTNSWRGNLQPKSKKNYSDRFRILILPIVEQQFSDFTTLLIKNIGYTHYAIEQDYIIIPFRVI